MRAARGFSLIELIMIIVATSVMGAFLAASYSQLPRAVEVSEGAQTAAQLAQQCSEQVIARRRSTAAGQGYASIAVGSNPCSVPALPAALAAYTVTGVVTDLTGSPPCPSAVADSCRRVQVTVTRNGVTAATTDLMLVNY